MQGCRHVYLLYTSHMKRFNLLPIRNNQYKNVDYFQRNARGGHLVFQNEAIFSPREAYPSNLVFLLRVLMPKISTCCGGGAANAKPKYPPDASIGYNNLTYDFRFSIHTSTLQYFHNYMLESARCKVEGA